MAEREIGQLGFADALVDAVVTRRRERLAQIDSRLDWSLFDPLLPKVSCSNKGEPAYPALMLFKALLLQSWYNLSDPALEEALSDRLSFRRFCGLSLSDRTPDHTTFWRFRERLSKDGALDALFGELTRQLDGQGAVLRQGTLIDASLITSAARRPTLDQGKTSVTDADARFGANNERRRFAFGYKLHIAVDAGSKLVRRLVLTPANVQEAAIAPELVMGDEACVRADRGYDSKAFRRKLSDQGIADGVMRRRNRYAPPLSEDAVRANHEMSLKRQPVEAVFGTLKRTYGFSRMRCFSLARNAAALTLACFAYNLKRFDSITAS